MVLNMMVECWNMLGGWCYQYKHVGVWGEGGSKK